MSAAVPRRDMLFSHAASALWRGDARALRQELQETFVHLSRTSDTGWTVISMPAPRTDPLILWDVFPDAPTSCWLPSEGPAVLGIGAAITIDAIGDTRWHELHQHAAHLFAGLKALSLRNLPDGNAPPPRLYGGLAFAPAADSKTCAAWREFGDARFVLPRWRYLCDGDRAWLSVALQSASPALPRLLDEYDQILERLLHAQDYAGLLGDPGDGAILRDDMDAAAWHDLVEQARRLIRHQQCRKIVAARTARIRSSRTFAVPSVLLRLRERQPGCTVFAFRHNASTFLGATPERLVARQGMRVSSEALAGTAQHRAERTHEHGQAALAALPDSLDSDKNRREQAVVVETILQALGPYCSRLDAPAAPAVRRLRDVLHLHTPIVGALARDVHVLLLAAALHPTPAVAGVPTQAALEWILRAEPVPRGWYAAPVGWFDAAGDGDFAVALRSGIVEGNEALIYAGAGLLVDSDADAEYRETALKQRALAVALGVPV